MPVDYLPNWFEPIFSSGLADTAAPEVESFSSTFNVMFAGNLGEAQDLPTVLEAARLCRDIPDLRWLVVGDGRVRPAMEAFVERMGLSEQVVFLGRHPSTQMPAFFKGADALLVSLKAEPIWSMTIPSKVQSYMAAGRPVVGMIDGEGARVITESGGGLASPAGDAAALAANVRRLMALAPEEREAMARAGRAYAAAHFDRDILFVELEAWLEEASVVQK
jgi:glycosyltransferase involved in cell wall biosynthesis